MLRRLDQAGHGRGFSMLDGRSLGGKLILGLGLGFAAGLAAWLLSLLPFLQTIELKTYDWRLRATARPTRPADAVVLVMINDD
ncbi:MAG: hypothetical protein ABR606_07830, partial [Vicinamibacterales bacterium]